MTHNSHITVIMLAAGLSRRMGDMNKLHLPIDNKGKVLVRHMAELYASNFKRPIVVTGFEHERTEAALMGLDLELVYNADYEAGQQSSVAVGLKAMWQMRRPAQTDGVMIALADQILLTSDDLKSFVDHFTTQAQGHILVPYFNEQRGNPILFPTQILGQIRDTDGSPNYRQFIDDNPELVQRYIAPNSHFTTDIDTLEDAQLHLGIKAVK